MVYKTGDNNFGTAKWIVDPTPGQGTHTTIAGALTSASSGETIFIRPGIYTENITLKAGVNLTSFGSESENNVIILGTVTASYNGIVSCAGIQFKSNGTAAISVSGASTSALYLNDSTINAANGSGIEANAANFAVYLYQCSTSAASTNKVFDVTTVAGIACYGCNLTGTSTASTIAAGAINVYGGELASLPISTTGTGSLNAFNVRFNTSLDNVAVLTTSGTGSSLLSNCYLASGTASAVSIGAGTTVIMAQCYIVSSNAAAIGGAGTIVYSCLSFLGTSSAITTTTKTGRYTQLGQYQATEQPAFLAFNSATDTDVTGDGTVYTIICDSEVFDQNSNYNNGTGVFTAPVSGRYDFIGKVLVQGGTSITSGQLTIVTSNRSYKTSNSGSPMTANTANINRHISALTDMDVGDTASITIACSDGGGKVDDVYGEATDLWTYFCGKLVC